MSQNGCLGILSGFRWIQGPEDAPKRASMWAAGTWLVMLKEFLPLHPWSPVLRPAYVKAHMGFRGKKLANGLAKWAAHAFPAPVPSTFRRSLTYQVIATVG